MSVAAEFAFVIEYVTDVESATRFYVERLGFKVQRTSPTFVQFDHFAIASDASMGGRRENEMYWSVADAEAAYNELAGRVEITMPLKQMPFGKVFGIKDPAGQPLYLIEFAQNRPSQQVT